MSDRDYLSELEDKFIVINKKRFNEVSRTCAGDFDPTPVKRLEEAIKDFELSYEARLGAPMNQKYIVCNQDEYYADEIARIILTSEEFKKRHDWEIKNGCRRIVRACFTCRNLNSNSQCKEMIKDGLSESEATPSHIDHFCCKRWEEALLDD